MDTSVPHFRAILEAKTAFWHLAASLAEVALKQKSTLRRLVAYAPVLVGAAFAFALGRLVGEILRICFFS